MMIRIWVEMQLNVKRLLCWLVTALTGHLLNQVVRKAVQERDDVCKLKIDDASLYQAGSIQRTLSELAVDLFVALI